MNNTSQYKVDKKGAVKEKTNTADFSKKNINRIFRKLKSTKNNKTIDIK